MFISNKEKKEIYSALIELTELMNKLRLDVERAKYGYRVTDGEPRIKPGRPVGSKNKVKHEES